ncbi:MAG: ankyrin repeat domain-containing protein [Alphaproteobacteria bacterium]
MTLRKAIADFFNEARKPDPASVIKALRNLCQKENLSKAEVAKTVQLINLAETQDDKFYAPKGEALALLAMAAMNNHRDVATALIDRGVNCDGKDEASMTPLMWTAVNGHVGTARMLIARGASIDETTAAVRRWRWRSNGRGLIRIIPSPIWSRFSAAKARRSMQRIAMGSHR